MAADRRHLDRADDAAARAGDVPGCASDRMAAADGGQRDEPGPDAADLLRSPAVLRPLDRRDRARRDMRRGDVGDDGTRRAGGPAGDGAGATGGIDAEVATQPACWLRAAGLAPGAGHLLPAPGERVAVTGCGTSWFIAQSYAALREASGQGETDAFAASEMPVRRHYDRVVVLSRSGTTTEILQLLDRLDGAMPTVAITAVAQTPVAEAAGAVIALDFADEMSVVQTRFATTELALLRAHLGYDMTAV